jgi:hypothetical protein
MSKHLGACGAVLGALVAATSAAGAQTCLGLPSTTVAPVNLSIGADFPEGAKGISSRFGFGGTAGFGGVSAGYITSDDDDVSATRIGADGGFAIPIGTYRRASLCPYVSGTYQFGPNIGEGPNRVEVSGITGSAGLALGGSVEVSPTFDVVPFARVGLLLVRTRVESGNVSDSRNETGGTLGGGVSLRFSDVFTLTPSVSIPVGFEGDSDPVFSLGAAIGFRRTR